MPITFSLAAPDGTETYALRLPTSWADVTLADYLRLHSPDADTVLQVLTGLDPDTLNRLAADDVRYLATALAFTNDPTPLLELLPTPGLPEVGASPYGLLVLATQHVESQPEGAPGILSGPYLYALYRCQQLYGKINDATVEAMRLAVLAEPLPKVYADVTFFLSSYRRATSATNPTPRTSPGPKKRNWKQALKSLASGSGTSSRSTASPKASG